MDSDDFEELPKRAASAKGHAAMDDAEEASVRTPSDAEDSTSD